MTFHELVPRYTTFAIIAIAANPGGARYQISARQRRIFLDAEFGMKTHNRNSALYISS